MIKNSHSQGFAHAFLIIGLVVALIGALGFVFWQNFIHEEPVRTELLKTEVNTKEVPVDASSDWKTYVSERGGYTIDYPASARVEKQSYEGIAEYVDLTREMTSSQAGLQISIAVYEGKYDNAGSGIPVIHDYVSVEDWYNQQGAENSVGTDGDSLLGYNFKLIRERGQTNTAAIYVLDGTTLYKIILQEGDSVELKNVDQNGATYSFSNEIKKILASFKTT